MYEPRYPGARRHGGKLHPWRTMLFTSSQVSIIITSAIFLLLTSVLFISGCAIQQRTLREIRQGIKTPKPSPKIYLPDRFKHSTTELKDGTIVILDDQPVVPIQQRNKPVVVQITPTEVTAETLAQDETTFVDPTVFGPLPKGVERQQKQEEPTTEREKNLQQQLEKNLKHPDPLQADQKLLSRAERRKLIKDEIKRLSHVEGPAYQRRLW